MMWPVKAVMAFLSGMNSSVSSCLLATCCVCEVVLNLIGGGGGGGDVLLWFTGFSWCSRSSLRENMGMLEALPAAFHDSS